MKYKSKLTEMLIAFCICTTLITIMEGVLGALFFPKETLSYISLLMIPFFALISVSFGVVTLSRKELSVRQVLIRRGIHLLMIEGLIFGANYVAGMIFTPLLSVILLLGIVVVYVLVYVVLWLNDARSARLFNQKLKEYQRVNYMLR